MFVLGRGCNLKTFRYKLIYQLFHLWCFQTIDMSMHVCVCVSIYIYVCMYVYVLEFSFQFFFQYLEHKLLEKGAQEPVMSGNWLEAVGYCT